MAGGKAVLFDTLDPDLWWHLRVAEQLQQDGIGPLVDRLSFASVQSEWTPYSWLAELGMKATWDAGGYRLAVAVQALMQAMFVVAIVLACRAACSARAPRDRFLPAPDVERIACRPSRMAAVCATAAAAFVSLPYLSFRPVTAALVLLAICGWLIVRDRAAGERTRSIWLIAPITALMVNLHLYAVLVPMVFATLLAGALFERWFVAETVERPEAGRRACRYFLLLAATGVACCCTPMLPGMIATALHYNAADPMVASGHIAEMRPIFHSTLGRIAAGVIGVALLCVCLRRRRFRMAEWLCVLLGVFLLSRMGRFAPVCMILIAPMFAVAMPAMSDRVLARRPLRLAIAVVVLLAAGRIVTSFPDAQKPVDEWVNRHGPDAPGYPTDAARYVEAQVAPSTGRLISEFSWGGYLEWRLGDRYQLFMDGRTQLFTPAFWRATYLGGESERVRFLSQVRADAAIVPAQGSLFRHALIRLGWRSQYKDARAEVLVPPRGMAVVEEDDSRWSVTSLLP